MNIPDALFKIHRYYLWRAVDIDGMVINILLQTRRNAKAAKRFFEGVLDQTTTHPRELLPDVEHRQNKYLNNRAENLHQPTRRRERGCNASNHRNKLSCFFRFLTLFIITFIHQSTDLK